MASGLIFIPKIVSLLVILGLVLFGIVEFRKGHIGRISIAGNAFLLWQIFFSSWNVLPSWFQWYLNLGTIFAVIAVPSYLFKNSFKTSLPTEFYKIAFVLYGSFSIIVAIIIAIYLKIPLI